MMIRIAWLKWAAVLLTAQAYAANDGVAQQWEQCGGMYHSGPTACASGLTCKQSSELYSQCLISEGSAGASRVQQYMQCGGENFSGPTECTDGLTCTYLNDYYSQCLRSDSTDSEGDNSDSNDDGTDGGNDGSPAIDSGDGALAPGIDGGSGTPASGPPGASGEVSEPSCTGAGIIGAAPRSVYCEMPCQCGEGPGDMCCGAGQISNAEPPSGNTVFRECGGCANGLEVYYDLNGAEIVALDGYLPCESGVCGEMISPGPYPDEVRNGCGIAAYGTPCCAGEDAGGAECTPNAFRPNGNIVAPKAHCREPDADDVFPESIKNAGNKTICKACGQPAKLSDLVTCYLGACEACPGTELGDKCIGQGYKGPGPVGIVVEVDRGLVCQECGQEGQPCCPDDPRDDGLTGPDGCYRGPGLQCVNEVCEA